MIKDKPLIEKEFKIKAKSKDIIVWIPEGNYIWTKDVGLAVKRLKEELCFCQHINKDSKCFNCVNIDEIFGSFEEGEGGK